MLILRKNQFISLFVLLYLSSYYSMSIGESADDLDISSKKNVMSAPELGPEFRCKCGTPQLPTGRIVGGKETKKNEFPWHVAITDISMKPLCGGSLINNKYILTAAHCFVRLTISDTFIRPGIYNYYEDLSRTIRVQDIIIHPRFDKLSYVNDIALVKIDRTLTLNETTYPPCIPRPGVNYTEKIATVIGLGRIKEGAKPSTILRKVEVPIISQDECLKAFGVNILLSSMICAGSTEEGKDACQGDSGGPLMVQMNSRWYLIGIVSWGYGCARPNHPGIYTRVDRFYKWIDRHTSDATFCTD